ncbi:sigma-70 family RNA polymerase sigma factor [Bacillus sp. 2205SS5-2]|uniref:sigma-70 family RNA polymerase sigma factor n=1 Tax=Bacillus sp. 2205SS5-2 TaxID=3109031 RepID=UPI0030040B5B
MESLIERAQNGSEHAFRILIETYKEQVFRSVYGVLRNQKDAEDASQDVWIKVYAALPQYQHQGFKTWITRIAINHSIDCKRKRSRSGEELVGEFPNPLEFSRPSRSHNVESILLQKEQKQLVIKKLEEAPVGYRDVLEGFYIQEKTYQQLAHEQNVAVKTIETKLYRARLWMRKHWEEEDF